MSIIQKLTLAHLKKNKGRTVVTILGICVSVAMITAVFVCIASFMNFFAEETLYTGGHWHAQVFEAADNEIDELKARENVSRVGLRANLDDSKSSFMIDYGVSPRTSTGNICAGDANWLSQIVTCDIDGKLPASENEILVEIDFIESNELDWQVGDTVTIPVGTRLADVDGTITPVNGSYVSGESFELSNIEEFTVSGIIDSNIPTRNYQIIRLASSDELNGATVLVEMKKIDFTSYADIKETLVSCNIDSDRYEINTDYLGANFSFAANSNYATSIIPMTAVILAVIIIASVALIYNAFGMSLSERTRYLGMLASVGATKQQKSSSVYFEGFLLGLIGIPIGIGAGVLGIYITLKAIEPKMQLFLNGAENLEMNVIVPLWVIIGIILVSALTIFISAMIPAKKASSITPIDALKQTNEIKVKAKKLKSSKLVRAIFGYEGELANKNLKRNGRKSRVITASIALSIILFLSVNSFCDMFVTANDLSNDMPYQVYVNVSSDEDFNLLSEEISTLSGVKDAFSTSGLNFVYGENKMNTNQDVAKEEYLTSSYKKLFEDAVAIVNFVDDDDFNALCEENGIDYKQYYQTNSENPLELNALLMNNISHDRSGPEVFNEKILGQSFYYDSYDEEGNLTKDNTGIKTTAKDFIEYDPDNDLCNLNSVTQISLYAPVSMYIKAIETQDPGTEPVMQLGIVTDSHTETVEQLEKLVDQNSLTGVTIMDLVDSMQTMNAIISVLQIFVYGFVALITLISVANIINTVSTGIDLRRKEFAMFKSVGTTPHGFTKMICLESLFYGLKAIVFGIPISILISYAMYLILSSNNIPFTINIPLYLIVIAVVFVIVGASMFYAVSKLKNDSIVETLKEDIC